MTQFQLDTSGAVEGVPPCGSAMVRYHGHVEWGYLSPFTQGYIEAALKDPRDLDCLTDHPPDDGPPRRGPYWIAFADLAPETLERIIADCERYRGKTASKSKAVGGLFWKNRAANYLSDDGWEPLTVQLGDDGKVRFA